MADTSYHDRRLSRRLQEDPEFRAEYERQRQRIAQETAPTRLIPRTAYVAQVELGGEWYDTAFIRSLVKAAEARTWNPAKAMSSSRGMWFSETTTIAVEQSQVADLVERGWAKEDSSGGYYGTDELLEAIEEAGGLPRAK